MANVVAYGFQSIEHLMAERVTDVGMEVVSTAITVSLDEYNRQVNEMMSTFVRPTTLAKTRFKQPGTGTLQPLDEKGNPLPTRPGGYYDVAYPIQGGGDAFGFDRVSGAYATVEDINRSLVDVQRRDADWLQRHIIAALVADNTWTYTDPLLGDLTIQSLANADAVTYPRTGLVTPATDEHYLAQANAIDDSNNPYDNIYDELTEHPGNDGPIVAYISSSLVATTKALTNFVDIVDPDLILGTGVTRLGTVPSEIVGFGSEVLGKVDNVWVVEWKSMPAGYILGVALNPSSPALSMREHIPAQLKGLFLEQHSPDGNLFESRYIRYAGFGVTNRVAALVYRIGNGTYATPTGYDTPLPV